MWSYVFGASLDDWCKGGCVDVLLTSVISLVMVSIGFCSLGSLSYSRKWVWDLKTNDAALLQESVISADSGIW